MAAAYLAAGSGNNSVTYTVAAADTSVPNTAWASMSSTANKRIKEFLDTAYTDLTAFLAAAAAAGLSVTVASGTAAAPSPYWTCGAASKPVLNFAAMGGAGHVRISLAYSAAR